MTTLERIYNYFDRDPQLRVLFIFDRMGGNEAELSGVNWPEDYEYKVFDGKWFNTKLAISREWRNKKVVLLFPYELRPDTEEKRLKFPLLDILASNTEFKDERYDEFIQQHNLPMAVATFVKNNIGELTSARISAMLTGYMNAEHFNVDLGCRAFISNYLGDKKLLDWEQIIVKMIALGCPVDEKKSADFFLRLNKNRDALKTVNDKLNDIFGVTFDPNVEDKMRNVAEVLKYNAITQSLSVLPADVYKALKISNRLMLDQINRIYEKGITDPAYSEKFKAAMKLLASKIREEELIKVYGVDAPYFFMTEAIGLPIIKSVIEDSLLSNPLEALGKLSSLSLRLGPTSPLMPLIRFVESAASFYDSTSHVESLRLDTPSQYIELYKEHFSKVDCNYRLTIEAYYQLPELDREVAQTVTDAKKRIDVNYAQLANTLNLEWLECIKDTGNDFKAVGLLRQNDFFSTYYSNKKMVVIISDALRYEVAEELLQELAKEKHMAQLSPMLSLLPTETKFCKPALFPHETLALFGDNMEVDGKVLSTVQQRSEQIRKYKSEAICVNFKDVCTQIQSHREIFKNQVVYVLHDRIDGKGHSGSAQDVVENCRKAVNELAKFIYSLHMTLNCNNVIVTADHGFLFNDINFEEKDKISIKEDNFDSSTRYYLTHSEAQIDEAVKFELTKSSSIKTSETVYVATPKGTNRFAAPGGYMFAHGGASLQEMIVPIICSNLRRESSKQAVGVTLKSTNLSMTSSRLRFQLVQKEPVSMDMVARDVVCQVYDGENPVTETKTVTLNSTDALNVSKRTYDVTLVLNKSVSGNLLTLRVYDTNDALNPLIKETVKNNTIIEQDF